jgi:hypothetical protein
MTELPARPVPVPAKIGVATRHHDDVPYTLGDLLLATRAQVGLTGLEGVDLADVDVAGGAGLATHEPESGRKYRPPGRSAI